MTDRTPRTERYEVHLAAQGALLAQYATLVKEIERIYPAVGVGQAPGPYAYFGNQVADLKQRGARLRDQAARLRAEVLADITDGESAGVQP